MKKGIAIILAVAIIGALGIIGKSHSSGNPASNGISGSARAMTQASDTLGESSSTPSGSSSSTTYKDGTYTGDSENTAYGTVQIAVVVSGGKITDVNFLQVPDDLGHSQEISSYAKPLLKQETLQKQSASIDFVSGATQTSIGYQQSLQAALDQA